MRIAEIKPPRSFRVGPPEKPLYLKDCAHIELDDDEQVTFKTKSGTEYDFCRKSWGYYASPSLNSRVGRFGLRPALVRGLDDKMYLMAAEKEKLAEFEAYLGQFGHKVICWLDDEESLARIEKLFGADR